MKTPKIAFLSMEIMVPELPEPNCSANFRGGLGILAGDILARMNEIEVEGIGFMPFYHRPWFRQSAELNYGAPAVLLKKNVVEVEGKDYVVAIWQIQHGKQKIYGLECPEIFDVLYTENRHQRLLQEIATAKTVPEILKTLDFHPDIVWLNESHTALVLPQIKNDPYFEDTKALFTIHTPEQAGMERFYDYRFESLEISRQEYESIFIKNGVLDLTWGAMVLADFVNAVSREHAEVTKKMFPQFRSKITGIRNGSDAKFWMYPELAEAQANGLIKNNEILMEIHSRARQEALNIINKKSGVCLNSEKPTAWFVRRLAGYKNLYPLLKAILPAVCANRGQIINTDIGPLRGLGMQMVGAGMAPETDKTCLWWMSEFSRMAKEEFPGKFVFVPEYNLELLKLGAQGSDVWLVTPEPKREACSTSDQRAGTNGIPSVTTKTGGMKEYIEEFNPEKGTGNGFFIEPYEPRTLYEKLSIFSDLWYAWRERGDKTYPQLKRNVFESGKTLDISIMLGEYLKLFKKITQ